MSFVTFAQNFEDVTLWRALNDVQDGFYVDVGASHPTDCSVTKAFSDRGWRGINIEPLGGKHALLQAERPRDLNLCVAVGDAPGELVLYEVTGADGLSTTDAVLADRYAAAGLTVERQVVPVETLASVLERHAPPTIHFLKLDCEGAELAALRGADFARFRPWIVLVEATEPNTPIPNHHGWEPLLLSSDYRFAWFDGLNRFYVAGEHHARLSPRVALPPNVFDGFVMPAAAHGPAVVDPFVAETPVQLSPEARIALTARCRDCDDVPKVADAGRVMSEPDGTRVQVMHNGLKVLADGYGGPWMTRLIMECRGHHEPQEERVFHEVVRSMPRDAVMIELGGHWAYYAAWFLSGAPERRAVVLEPDPQNRACGEATLRLNGLRASVVEGFVGAPTDGPAPFATERSGQQQVRGYSVETLMQAHGIDRLDLLHADTHGAELAMLEACRPLFLAGRVGTVMVSTLALSQCGDPLRHQRCLAVLRSCGGIVEAEHDPYESYSGDGMIVARFGPALPGWRPVRTSIARRSESLFRDPLFELAALSGR